MSSRHAIDRPLLIIVSLLLISGAIVFVSASLGLLARNGASVASIVTNHLALGLGGGLMAFLVTSRVHYRHWKPLAPYLYAAALTVTALVFVPGLGYSAGGARRWIDLGFVSFQPSEALKIGIVLFAAYFFTHYRNKVDGFLWGFGGFVGIVLLPAILLLLQPDTGTLGVMIAAVGAIFFASGARWRDIAVIVALGLIMLAVLSAYRPYVRERMLTFFNPEHDPRGSSYQVQQSLIAIGSGGIMGKGFGQSIQKFEYLPEPVNDSIFAVAGEEFGFAGTSVLVLLFLAFVTRILWLSTRVPDIFGALLMLGIGISISAQAFINIASMLNLIPLTGIPLVFMSQGGTALLVALAATGIVCNISRHAKH